MSQNFSHIDNVMSKKPTIKPIAEDNGMLCFGDDSLNIERIYNIDPNEYLLLIDKLIAQGLRIRFPDAKIQIDFALYSRELINMNFNLQPLISEFNRAQKSDLQEVRHAISLIQLCYHYKKNRFNISVNKTKSNQPNPDLTINNVTCELKVRNDQLRNKMQKHKHLLQNGQSEEYHRLYFESIRNMHEDLIAAKSSRLDEGLKQSNCIIFDLSNHFHTWNFHRLRAGMQDGQIKNLSEKPILPSPKHLLIFAPKNAINLNENSFNPKALWGYVSI